MENQQQVLWNFDDEELKLISQIKIICASHFASWKLTDLYWRLKDLHRETDAIHNENERSEVKDLFHELEQIRVNFEKNDQDPKIKSDMFLACEQVYLKLCLLMKKHGVYFREGDDPRKAGLRR